MLYHKNVYMPKQIRNLPECQVNIDIITNHAKREAKQDKYGLIQLNHVYKFDGNKVIEFEKTDEFKKFVVRYNTKNSEYDSVYVIRIYNTGKIVLVTCWLNHNSDNHSTLDTTKYYHPNKTH